jgi:signal transduction histidine kinase
MYYKVYVSAITIAIVLAFSDRQYAAIAVLTGLCGLFLGLWESEKEKSLSRHDTDTGKFYELEGLQSELLTATAQIERMTAISERARISREIHDNAGHEIVAAFISLQTARGGFDESNCDPKILHLYDSAMERLDTGMDKIREAVHNLSSVTALGVETLQEICKKVPARAVEFSVFGNTSHVPVHIWSVLEACLNETVTNAMKHAPPHADITANLDTTPHLVRLCVENEHDFHEKKPPGSGLKNLRHRASAAGGSLSVDSSGKKFRVICVIPIERGEV